ncbi:PucR family transcriptional regulator [Nocardia niwae]|uniref:PucR family transcriptional regulator n=1 Tax=Nocardia niwae TaxID=626084 RepID=UPI0007A3B3BF|nr:helix-turn-helix domain-containing protein [Nocardia niwae]
MFLDVEPQLVSRALLSMGIAIARWYQAECGWDPAAPVTGHAARYQALAEQLHRHLGTMPTLVEMHDLTRDAIPAAVRQSHELAELARQLGRPAGIYTLADLMVEYQITRPGPARELILATIEPLTGFTHLIDALHASLRRGYDRKQAARDLCLHPNSLSYRLRRIAQLTGYDPTDPADSRILAAGLIAYEAQRHL